MQFKSEVSLCFNDVLLRPQFSPLTSRKEVDISSPWEINGIKVHLPIISAPMDTVSGIGMVEKLGKLGGIGILHRSLPMWAFSSSINRLKLLGDLGYFWGVSIPATGDYLERAEEIKKVVSNPARLIVCLDTAYACSNIVFSAIKNLEKILPDEVTLMIGNIATVEGYNLVASFNRVGMVRVGVGGGAVCSTRIKTGHGLPTLQALLEIESKAKKFGPAVIADGGLRNPGDCVKAFAAGSDFVMLGCMLAGTLESPGEIFKEKDKNFKSYRGMASLDAKVAANSKTIPCNVEGVTRKVVYKGPLNSVIRDIQDGIRSGCSYSGARSIVELQQNAVFQRVSSLSIKESNPI